MSGIACSSLLVSLFLAASADVSPSPVGKRVELNALTGCLGADAEKGLSFPECGGQFGRL